ncbi:MAG: hypothetical protein AMJ79_07205 [Phycisphaerae bacterium SM23_30]|nr:MAG: hypothetical protein AMJ79_07205 [Phycisphaerae bacterium SM23_30]
MLPEKTRDKITQLYGPAQTPPLAGKIEDLLGRYSSLMPSGRAAFLSERDVMLITYADSLRQPDAYPLQAMTRFAREYFKDIISIIHILPFFPYSSDDGFSVIDYRRVNPAHGDWSDVAALAEHVDLCFDLVVNHCSASSKYFQGYLAGEPEYEDFFISLDPDTDTSCVLRPRTSPLLHRFAGAAGEKWCWTTFSADQIDFNFHNPAVLLEMLDILLFYVWRGARIIRLDAIAYLWKEPHASCAHLPQTHTAVQLMRDILDLAAPQVLLLTETNVPHADNISYFGDGTNEAQIVYNFPLPPLVLYTLTAEDAAPLTRWAQTLEPVSERTTFLNFTASHDGIGVRPAADILSPAEFQGLIELAERHGGQVSCKHDRRGNAIPYELNLNYFDALNNPHAPAADQTEIDRFILSQSIALVLMGMPAIYIHSLLGRRGWPEGAAQTGHPRTINRQKLDLEQVRRNLTEKSLPTGFSRSAQVFQRYLDMIRQRRRQRAFHPRAGQQVLDMGKSFFAVLRTALDESEAVLAVHNVTGRPQRLNIEPGRLGPVPPGQGIDLISGQKISPDVNGSYQLDLPPYGFLWLKVS